MGLVNSEELKNEFIGHSKTQESGSEDPLDDFTDATYGV